MSIQIFILSKLMAENNYPYKLKKELSSPIPFDEMGKLTESKLYYHFDSLLKQGLVETVEVIHELNRPDKQIFSITDEGRKQLPLKMYELFTKANNLGEMIVGLVYIEFVDRQKVIEIFENRLKQHEEKLDKMISIYAKMKEKDQQRPVVMYYNDYFKDKMDRETYWLRTLIEGLKTKKY
ncbi:PadR family transcriptional regulator [Kurthia sibirica]|uniref:Transcriptional regulator n=1 Tax=Kurthia sibirica TaxID=202750 RepID=A0A2U3AJK7_9BACL|nr:PadR family transcriptional regulator [Kurthia sibirica]PWI24717.1 transcriptional regulator [Kurthia sibirica]GEK34745.1 hypothetical protein KSI01_22780 [Kurthia sibirica]